MPAGGFYWFQSDKSTKAKARRQRLRDIVGWQYLSCIYFSAIKKQSHMQGALTQLVDLFRRTFDGTPWHGPAVMEVLRSLKIEQTDLRVGDSHSIGELVAHIVAWREFAIKKLEGDAAYGVSEEANFPMMTAEKWPAMLERLEASQQRILELLEVMPAEKLDEITPGKAHALYILLHGVVQHDLYHLGQIVLMKQYV